MLTFFTFVIFVVIYGQWSTLMCYRWLNELSRWFSGDILNRKRYETYVLTTFYSNNCISP